MKVKIGNKFYDANDEPIMIILNDKEKNDINSMASHIYKYCVYPDAEEWKENNYEKIRNWMKEI